MAEPISTISINDVVRIEGNSLIARVGDYVLTLKIEGPEPKPSSRLQLGRGQTLFDLVLDAAKTFIQETGESEFSATDLYHIAANRNQELSLRRNGWNSHVVSSAPNHPSYRYYTSHREYFHYLGRGKYSIDPYLLPESKEMGTG